MKRSDILQNINWKYASLGPGDTFVGLPNLDKVLAFWAVVPSWVIVPLHMLGQGLPEPDEATPLASGSCLNANAAFASADPKHSKFVG